MSEDGRPGGSDEDGGQFTYAVVGGGIAGVSCVEQILAYEPSATILLVSATAVVKEATNVTHLTKTLQDFVLVEKSLKSFKDVHQSVHVLHDSVDNVDWESHTLKTRTGKLFSYRKLCICTGAKPHTVFPESEYVVGIRDTDSVKSLKKKMADAKRVLVIGNGGIATELVHEVEGVEIYWIIKDKSISYHYIDPGAAQFFIKARIAKEQTNIESPAGTNSNGSSGGDASPEKKQKTDDDNNPLPRVVKRQQYTISETDKEKVEGNTEPGSALGPDWHRNLHLHGLLDKKNTKIYYETECKRLVPKEEYETKDEDEGRKWPIYVELSNGEIVGADLIISATGVTPNSEWLGNVCGKNKEGGLFVNTTMRTTVPDVFAAGDVCHPKWQWAKHWFPMKLWTQARQMGLYAGKSMYLSHINDTNGEASTGEDSKKIELDFCFEIFSHVTRFFGFKVVLLGLYNAQNLQRHKLQYLVRCTEGVEYLKVVMEDGRMQGAILIGDTGLEETFENLILNQLDLSGYGEELLSCDIDIEDYFD